LSSEKEFFKKTEKSFTFCLTSLNKNDNISSFNMKRISYFRLWSKNMQKKLSEFSIGESGVIIKVDGEGRIKRRLFDMGVTPGTEVYLRKKAPFGDPIEITIRGYELTLRNTEAEKVAVEVKGE
jgi:Fe2+ transport system protein FeoA